MKSAPFEVRSGRPTEILVKDEAGNPWSILVNVSVAEINLLEGKNPDGSPKFGINFGFSLVTRPAVES